MTLENGKTYLVNHSRKGTFALRVDRQDDTWIDGVIVGGKARAMCDYNERLVGEPITVRASHLLSVVPQP